MLLDRRGFVGRVISAAIASIGLGLGTPALIYVFGASTRRESGWVDAGAIESLPEAQPVELPIVRMHRDGWKITAEQETVWVLKENGQVTAFSPRCTHLGCAYHWENARKAFICPCHGSLFSETGAVISGPANRPLDRYITRIDGHRLWLGRLQAASDQQALS